MTPSKAIVSPEPRKTRNEAFDDLEDYSLKKGEIGWIEKTSDGWVACISQN